MEVKKIKVDEQELFNEHVKKSWKFFESIGKPKYIVAPMVSYSTLPFRMMTRKYGAELCYSPMINVNGFCNLKLSEIKTVFTTCQEDRPLVVQLNGNEPDKFVYAASKLQEYCDAIDINLGCPQTIAKRGHYGSFLLEDKDQVLKIIRTLKQANLKVPITCKIRKFTDVNKTIEYCKEFERAGVSILTIHGRTRLEINNNIGKCDWDAIKRVKDALQIPVFANGGIHYFSDIEACLKETGVNGVMSGEALIENPALFSNKNIDIDDLALELLQFCQRYEPQFKMIKGFFFKILYTGCTKYPAFFKQIAGTKNYEELEKVITEMKNKRSDMSSEEKFGWYQRHKAQSKNPNKEKISMKFKKKKKNSSDDEEEEISKDTKQEQIDQINEELNKDETENYCETSDGGSPVDQENDINKNQQINPILEKKIE